MDCVPAEILPVLEHFTPAPPIQTLWCVITFKLAPAFPPAETLVESLPFAQLPVFIKLAKLNTSENSFWLEQKKIGSEIWG